MATRTCKIRIPPPRRRTVMWSTVDGLRGREQKTSVPWARQRRPTGMRVTIGVALCRLGGAAHAEVVVRPGVGFTAAQLEAAIRARGGPEDSKLDVEVSSSGPGRLALVMPAGRWEIALGVASG